MRPHLPEHGPGARIGAGNFEKEATKKLVLVQFLLETGSHSSILVFGEVAVVVEAERVVLADDAVGMVAAAAAAVDNSAVDMPFPEAAAAAAAQTHHAVHTGVADDKLGAHLTRTRRLDERTGVVVDAVPAHSHYEQVVANLHNLMDDVGEVAADCLPTLAVVVQDAVQNYSQGDSGTQADLQLGPGVTGWDHW